MVRIFMVVLAISLFSCSDSNNITDPAGALGLGTFEVKIDGTDWSASDGFVFASVSVTDTLSTSIISATRSISADETENFGIVFSKTGTGSSNLEGTYSLDPLLGITLIFTKINSTTSIGYYSTSGTLKITDVTSTNIKGTFDAICKNQSDENDTITLTNGAFNAAIITDQP
jgi:hypothetical protein